MHGAIGTPVCRRVTISTQRDQVLLYVLARVAAVSLMVHRQSVLVAVPPRVVMEKTGRAVKAACTRR